MQLREKKNINWSCIFIADKSQLHVIRVGIAQGRCRMPFLFDDLCIYDFLLRSTVALNIIHISKVSKQEEDK